MNCKYILLFLIVSFSSVESIDFVLFTEPKTGTHFLIPILEELTKKKVYWAPEFQKNETLSEYVEIASEDPNFFIFSLNQLAWNKKTMDQVWDIAINSRRFLHLHAPYSIPMENYMIEKKCINFFIKRDPRDQIVSLLNHYKYIHFNDKEVELIPTDDERLLYMIKNQLRINTINFRKWLTSSMCCVLNFEKLIGFQETKVPQADAMEEMRKMTAALQLETSDEHLIRIYEKHFGRGWSFFKGKSGVWRDYFNEEHKRAVKEEIGDLLIEWGYEENLDW
ncbi:MAG: sulfotransferase domain-containing protein [Parachlamydiaceae bacterium]